MKHIFEEIENSGISVHEYTEDNKVCGYELNTYTDGGVNQIIFVDFRDTDKDPNNETDFIEIFSARINSIDIDEELELNRQDKSYCKDFTIKEGLKDFKKWKDGLLELVKSLKSLPTATPSPLPEIEKPMTKDEYWETMADLKTDVKRNTTPGNERQEIEKQSTQLIEELKQDWEEIKTRMKELEALEALEAGFYMAICRAYNAGKQNVIDDAAFISSYEYFKSEFPGFTKNVPCDY